MNLNIEAYRGWDIDRVKTKYPSGHLTVHFEAYPSFSGGYRTGTIEADSITELKQRIDTREDQAS